MFRRPENNVHRLIITTYKIFQKKAGGGCVYLGSVHAVKRRNMVVHTLTRGCSHVPSCSEQIA